MAGSIANGPYGTTAESCQPSASVQVATAMWSVKLVPNPGSSRIAARSLADRGWGFLRCSNSSANRLAMTVTLTHLLRWP